jgi:hypothetical protein
LADLAVQRVGILTQRGPDALIPRLLVHRARWLLQRILEQIALVGPAAFALLSCYARRRLPVYPRRVIRPGVVLTLCCVTWLWSVTSWASTALERDLKVALLYNFAKFVEWPADALPPAAPISFCVLGDAALAGALGTAVASHSINGHGMTVTSVTANAPLTSCHVLYLSDVDIKRAAPATAALGGAAVLIVSDLQQFEPLGAVVGLFLENGKMRFSINLAAAQRRRLVISSRLLALAVILHEGSPTQ